MGRAGPMKREAMGLRLALRFVLLAAACCVFSCATETQQYNVMVIGVDTLRPDHLGCYGYERDTSPEIDKLAGEGVLFENVMSQSPWTLPSFATVFTSLYPTQHGAGTMKSMMRTSFPPLAMMLLKQGYSTGAIINAPALRREFGLNRGFEVYDTNPPSVERTADQVTEDALEWIDQHRQGPFFIFVHYFDPHLSYSPPEPYDTVFDPDYRGRIGDSFDLTEFPRARVTNFETMKVLTEEDWNHIRSLYDGEIAFTDKAIGTLMQGIEEMGLREKTLIVFLSDHGEEFFEHGGFEHGHTHYNELLRVPMIFSFPGELARNTRVSRQVRLLDVTPTVLDFLGIEPDTHLEGISLRPLLTGVGDIEPSLVSLLPHDIAFAEAMLHGREQKSITAYPWKLIRDAVTGDEMLFNLEDDPGENTDLLTEAGDTRTVLEEVLFKTLFGLSDTWYVELAGGGADHTFDLAITTKTVAASSSFELRKVMDEKRRFVADDVLEFADGPSNVLRLEDITLSGSLTLAFQVRPWRVPLSFDLRIDGVPAIGRTYLGESLSEPDEMPFVEKDARASESRGIPPSRPSGPYFLVWHTTSSFKGTKEVRLDDATRKELRALGYIQ
jgi:arylsulfatase A-like enzyme